MDGRSLHACDGSNPSKRYTLVHGPMKFLPFELMTVRDGDAGAFVGAGCASAAAWSLQIRINCVKSGRDDTENGGNGCLNVARASDAERRELPACRNLEYKKSHGERSWPDKIQIKYARAQWLTGECCRKTAQRLVSEAQKNCKNAK